MVNINYQIENFSGPLDLLLVLVSKHKVELWQIKIYEIIDQYLEIISRTDADTLDYSSDFVSMAARLVRMKSAALLPRQDEADDMAKELVGQLIELKLAKEAAARLREMAPEHPPLARRPQELEGPPEYRYSHEPSELLTAYSSVVIRAKAAAREPDLTEFNEIVAKPVIPVGTQILHIMRKLKRGAVSTLRGLFTGLRSRSEAIASFLGILELVKGGRITVSDSGKIKLKEGVNGAQRSK
ncbi:MAG: segregation and condensation protein A [Oscillospiraceae bacterium]|jgi:segregation and condensation protein A